mmetsp:Transcript_53190/g.95452  ORF Transcript_53190/g.95452 Transcript_53190/m.95452 type:complete len:176 (+) Transcript_53190:44-571(+)
MASRSRLCSWKAKHVPFVSILRVAALAAICVVLRATEGSSQENFVVASTRSHGPVPLQRGLTVMRVSSAARKAADKKKKAASSDESAKKERKVKDDVIEMDGTVLSIQPTHMQVKLINDVDVLCTLAGKLRKNNIKVMLGDAVKVELSPFDLTRGRIVFRSLPDLPPTAAKKPAR